MSRKIGQFVIEMLKTFLFSLLCVIIIINFIAMPCRVDGKSMYPTLKDGEMGFSSIATKLLGGVERFDIVVIDMDVKYLVKRVIGLPGEYLEYRDDVLYINGEAVSEDFLDREYMEEIKKQWNRKNFTEDFSIQLGEDEYFCMGDNRYVSQDSRFYGPFPLEDLHAKGLWVYFPFHAIRIAD